MNLQPLLTLIVDDSEDDRILFSRALRFLPAVKLAGMVTDASEAIAYLTGEGHFGNRADYPFPDLILLDYQMPRGDGMHVLKHLEGELRRPKIILWSHAIEFVDKSSAYRLGADVVCAKPLTAAELLQLVKQLDSIEVVGHDRTADTLALDGCTSALC